MQSRTSMPPKFGFVIFIDRSLGAKRLPQMLERMGFEVELHKNYFVDDEDDDSWIPQVASRKWVILSGDKRLSVEPLNKLAVKNSRAQVLLVTDTNSLAEQWASSIIVGRQKIQELLDRNPGPVFIKIGKQAKEHVNVAKEHLFTADNPPSDYQSEAIGDGSEIEVRTRQLAGDMSIPKLLEAPENATHPSITQEPA